MNDPMFDFIVVGGGMIGSALALGLGQQGHKVAIVEQHLPLAFSPEQPPDIRMSALSLGTMKLLEQLGAWDAISQSRTQPYSKLTVWESAADENRRTRFDAQSIGVDNLGFFVENRLTQLGLHEQIQGLDNVSWFTSATVVTLDCENATVTLSDGQELTANFIVGADGAQSQVRALANIGQSGWQYGQQALGVTIKTTSPSTHETWQRFRPEGPIAYLPMFENYAALIWYDNADKIRNLKSMSIGVLAEHVKDMFVEYVGEFEALQSAAFPLTRAHANQYIRKRVILVGDAAHTINPLAGQGVNIGFQDVNCLLSLFAQDNVISEDSLRKSYQQPRMRANQLMMSSMDAFYYGFSNDILPLKLLRNGLLRLADNAGAIKQQALKYAVGIQ